MIATSFVYIVLFAGMAVLFGLVGALGTYALQGEAVTRGFLKSYFVTFNAIGVASFGYALMLFLRNTGKSMIGQLSTILEIPEEHAIGFARAVDRATSTRWANVIAVPLTIVGSIALWWRGFPLEGFAKLYLAACSFSIYYVASNILSFFIYVILLFRYVEERSAARGPDRFRLKCAPASMEIQTIDTFLIVSTTISVITLYIGVRATLTANFSDDVAVISELLLLPFILYLPATLCYSFYPRYVLRQISENETLVAVEEFERQVSAATPADIKSNLELRKLIIDVKEKMLADCRSLPILGLKDAPSLTMSIIIVLQLMTQKDKVFAEFFTSLFK